METIIITSVSILISGLLSLLITHRYYKRATKDLEIETNRLREMNTELAENIKNLEELSVDIWENSELTKKHAVHNTIDDPEYPNK